MKSFWTLWRREIAIVFLAPTGYALGAAFLLIAGLSFWWQAEQQAFDAVSVPYLLFASVFFWILVLITVAVIAMRLVAEERANGTFDLLLSAPVPESTIILAKYAGGLTLFAVLCAPTLLYPFSLQVFSQSASPIDPGPVGGACLVLFLTGGLFLAIGTLMSTLSRSQLVAGIAGFAVSCVIFFAGHLARVGSNLLAGRSVAGLVPSHYVLGFAAGVIDTRLVVACLTGTILALFLAVKVLQWQRFHAFHHALNLVLGTLLLGVFLGMANYIAQRHYVLLDWTRSGSYSLADRTRKLLDTLESEIEVTVFCRPRSEGFMEIRLLLAQYQQISSRIKVDYVDPDRDLVRARELVNRDPQARSEWIRFAAGGRSRYVYRRELVPGGEEAPSGTRRNAVRVLCAEQLFSAAIQELAQARRAVVYFLSGNGERDINDYQENTGYSALVRIMHRENLDVRTLLLEESSHVPEDCETLVIAGPDRPLGRGVVQAISEYLGRSGRMLCLLDADVQTGLEEFLEDWGVRMNHDRVVTKPLVPGVSEGVRGVRGIGISRELGVTHYGDHPITRDLQGILTTFYQPQSITALAPTETNVTDHVDKPRVTVLAQSGEDSWAESDMENNPPHFDPEADRRGPVAVAVAVEKGPVGMINVEILPTRLVVIGDSQFAANGFVSGGNQDFFMNAVQWLLRKEQNIGIAPKTHSRLFLIMDPHRQVWALLWIVLGLPACLAGAGGLVFLVRRGL